MMTLELEYFFLCSGWGHASHLLLRVGPAAPHPRAWAPGWATGGLSGGEGCCSVAPCGHQEGLKPPAERRPPSVPRTPTQPEEAYRLGVRRGGGAGPPSAVSGWLPPTLLTAS